MVDTPTFTILNVTEPGHRYHPGTVRITVEPFGPTQSWVTIEGVGWGENRLENILIGEAAFGATLEGLAQVCGSGMFAPPIP